MHLSHPRVHEIVRGDSLPVDEVQARALAMAVTGVAGEEAEEIAERAVDLFVRARRVRDGAEEPGDQGAPAVREPALVPAPREATGTVPEPVAVTDQTVGRRTRRRPLWFALCTTIVALLGAVGWTAASQGAQKDEALGAETQASSVLFQDSFDTDDLDLTKWERPNRADLIRPDAGQLNMTVGPSETATGVEAEIVPKALDGFREIAFVTAVPAYTRSGPGGGALTLTESDGRTHRVLFGPSAGGPEIAVLICSQAACSQYEDYDPPARYESYAVGEKVPVRVVQTDRQLQFYVRDTLVAQGPRDDAPLATFAFDLYGAKREAWHLSVDSVVVSR